MTTSRPTMSRLYYVGDFPTYPYTIFEVQVFLGFVLPVYFLGCLVPGRLSDLLVDNVSLLRRGLGAGRVGYDDYP